ncbi:MAG: CsbD family protein [Luteitalea sp.]
MNRDEIKGKIEQGQGKVKQAIGSATGDERLHDEGHADEAAGEVREGAGKVRRNVGEAIENVGEKLKR